MTGNPDDGDWLAGSGRTPGSRVVAFATWLLALLGAGLMYVGFDAQYTFVLAQKGDRAASLIEAAMLDAGMAVIRQHILPLDAESAWAPLGRAAVAMLRLAAVMALYLLRTVFAPSGTLRGLRQMVLDAAPVPGMTGSRQVCGEQLPAPMTRTGARAPASPLPGSAPRRPRSCPATGLTSSTATGQLPGRSLPSSRRSRACRREPGGPTSPRSCASSPT
jgi:hypothetical protein